jgi:NitT/TauT family transport system substrate-binding protein
MRETIRNPSASIGSVLKRDDSIRRDVELERLRMAIRDNIVTPETRANGFGAVDPERFEEAINQIGLTYSFKAKPTMETIFDSSFLPHARERRVN